MFKIQAVCRLHLVAVLQVIIQRLQSYLPFSELLFLNTACIVQTCKKKKKVQTCKQKAFEPTSVCNHCSTVRLRYNKMGYKEIISESEIPQ